ncbi:MAG: NAD(P)/FAD-dependent oxidoreductase [Myxococcota bacterium]
MATRDIVIVGQGPAGLSAAIYTSRAGMDTLVLGMDSQVAGDYDIDNYFGFPEGTKGDRLIELGREHARRFGSELVSEKALAMSVGSGSLLELRTDAGEHSARAVILATGVSRAKPRIKGLSKFEGKGVSYCASCDAFFYREKSVIVVGEGVFAADQALEMREYTPHVRISTQDKSPGIPRSYLERLEKAGIEVAQERVVGLEGNQVLESVVMADGSRRQVDGLFVALGEASAIDFARSLGIATRGSFIEADEEQRTNIPGVFAAGDCVGRYLQICVAVGEGAIAARSAIDHVKGLR